MLLQNSDNYSIPVILSVGFPFFFFFFLFIIGDLIYVFFFFFFMPNFASVTGKVRHCNT